ncbi:hypothetical protein RB653_004643 [Dictyostelium firmibasis]|uniref:Uncharacterized protein n=1 Tax=Dictyostelium firmibasis TaxID=79012 RepID=A0AAN7UJP7_9MYCE
MAKKKSNNNNNNNNNNNDQVIKEEIIDSDEEGWEEVPTKEQRNKEMNEKREKRKLEKDKKRQQEISEHNEKQKKIAELFADSSKAFNVKNRPAGYNPWEILEEDEDDVTHNQEHQKRIGAKQTTENPNNGFHYPGSDKLSNSNDKLKKKKKQTQQLSPSDSKHSLLNAIQSFNFDKYYDLLKNIEKKYPKVIDVQIKCVAECLEEHFGSVQSDQSPFNQRIDYLSKFDDKFKKETTKFFSDRPMSNILPTVVFLVNNIISILRKDKDAIPTSGVGLEILLQLIFRYFPDSLIKNLQYFKSLNLQTLKPNVVSLYLWFFSQPIQNNLHSVTASIWLQIVFPILYKAKVSNHSNLELFEKFTIQLFELKRVQKNGIEIEDTVLANSLDEFINSLILQTVQPIGMKYSDILFDLKKLFSNNKIPSSYFYVLLNYSAMPDEALRERFLNKVIGCLNTDSNCFVYLKGRYVEFIAQINNLLLFVLLQWKSLEKKDGSKQQYQHQPTLSKQSVYELALFCRDENNNLLLKRKLQIQQQQEQQQQQQQQGKQTKRPQKSIFDVEDVNLCNITCNSVIQTLKPSHLIRNLTYLVMVPLVIVGSYYSRQMFCDGNLNQYLPKENIELLQKYLC